MPTEIIDVIDTAIKIGLGASIAGITSYVVLSKKHNLEKDKLSFEEERSLVKDIALNFEDANKGTNNLVTLMAIYYDHSPDDKEIVFEKLADEVTGAVTHLSFIKASANLLGLTSLMKEVDDYITLLSDIHTELHSFSADNISASEYIKQKILVIRDSRSRMYPMISNAYESVKANK
jgi:hypothetical protein